MTMKSGVARYGMVPLALHWVSALLIVVLVVLGIRADGLAGTAAKAEVLAIHVPLGITVLVLTLLRLVWWVFVDTKPEATPMPRWQDRAARAIHRLFYIVILGTAASGAATVALSGAAPVIFGTSTAELPNFHDFAPRAAHGFGAMLLIALFVFHAGAALHHQFVKRDGLLKRMWFGRS